MSYVARVDETFLIMAEHSSGKQLLTCEPIVIIHLICLMEMDQHLTSNIEGFP